MKIGLVYYTGTGTTEKYAQSYEQGLASSGAEVFVHLISGSDITEGRWSNDAVAAELDSCEAIVFGTPTYMGGVSAQLKSFMDAMAPRWYQKAWNGKYGAAFTVSAKASGDKLNCLQDVLTFGMQMGMIWIGVGEITEPTGYYIGVGGSAMNPDAISETELENARQHGERIASFVAAKGA